MSMRIKGQDVSVSATQDGVVLAQVVDVKDFEGTIKLKKLQEGYTGQKTDQYDEVLEGADFKLTMHTSDAAVFDMIQAMIDKAQSRAPGTIFNVKGVFAFPNGSRKRMTFNDSHWGNIPIAVPGRSEYVGITLDGSCSSPRFL